jgi:hypothetical protein
MYSIILVSSSSGLYSPFIYSSHFIASSYLSIIHLKSFDFHEPRDIGVAVGLEFIDTSQCIVVLDILTIIVPPEIIPWSPKARSTLILYKPLFTNSEDPKLPDGDLFVLDPKLVVY